MSLTKAALFEQAKPRFEWVDVPPFGKIGIRSVSRLRRTQRESSYRDPETGELIPAVLELAEAHVLIDQIMIDEQTPMFDESDAGAIGQLDAAKLGPLLEAVAVFNGAEKKPMTATESSG